MSKGAILQNTKYIRTFAAMIKENLQQILKAQGTTQKALCKKLDITPQTLQYYFRGNITLARLNEIAGAVGVQPWELIKPGGGDQTTRQPEPRTQAQKEEPRPTPPTLICPRCGFPIKYHIIAETQDDKTDKSSLF